MGAPWTDVTLTGVYWNDPDRVAALLRLVRPWFVNLVVGVQTNDPANDETLARCREIADRVIVDRVHGFCEPTIGKVLRESPTEWVFLVSADETPSAPLLGAFQDILDDAAANKRDAYWVRMISSIEGIEYPSEQDNHLRVFKKRLGWPTTMHSRPEGGREFFWRAEDFLRHDRSLQEMVGEDYLRYLKLSGGNQAWIEHNVSMIYNACMATAHHYGWPYVKAYPWWPEVRRIAFNDQEP